VKGDERRGGSCSASSGRRDWVCAPRRGKVARCLLTDELLEVLAEDSAPNSPEVSSAEQLETAHHATAPGFPGLLIDGLFMMRPEA
jgi:hypothetical protein